MDSPAPGGPVLVDCRGNPCLMREQVAFHWWNERATSLHRHNFYEFFLITDGSAAHTLNGVSSELPCRTLHMIRPSDAHQIVSAGETGCTHINLLILPEKLKALCDALDVPLAALSAEPLAVRTELSAPDAAFFSERADRLNLAGHGANEAARLILEMIAEALFLLCRRLPAVPEGQPAWFSELTRALRSPERLACRAADVYEMAPCSAPVLIRCFRAYEGCTVVEYLTRVRMDYAMGLLQTTNFSIAQISARLGYDSVSHFCRVFRAHTGRSPKAYRAGHAN